MSFDIKKQIALKVGLTELDKAGITIIRDGRRFRINEKDIEYFWILIYSHVTGHDHYGLFTIKFNESTFREFKNPKEMIKGMFSLDVNGIHNFYSEIEVLNFEDTIVNQFNKLDFVYSKDLIGNAVPSIVQFVIESKNISTQVHCQYIENKEWVNWNNEIIKFSKSISERSKNLKLQELTETF